MLGVIWSLREHNLHSVGISVPDGPFWFLGVWSSSSFSFFVISGIIHIWQFPDLFILHATLIYNFNFWFIWCDIVSSMFSYPCRHFLGVQFYMRRSEITPKQLMIFGGLSPFSIKVWRIRPISLEYMIDLLIMLMTWNNIVFGSLK